MTLTFTDSGNGYYVASATVEKDFNLHLEFGQASYIQVYKSTIYGKQKALWYSDTESVFDEDFSNVVYPKYLEIRTTLEPFEGTITEVPDPEEEEASE